MHPIIQSIEQDNFEEFTKLVENPDFLIIKDKDGWDLLSLVTQYQMPEYAELLLNKLSPEQIANQQPTHPLLIAFKNNDNHLAQIIANHPNNTQVDIRFKNNETLLHLSILEKNEEVVRSLIKKRANPYLENNQGENPITWMIEHGMSHLARKLVNKKDFSEHYNEEWIRTSIRKGDYPLYEKLKDETQLDSDILFDIAINAGNVRVLADIIEAGDILPGHNQITQLIETICEKYSTPEEQEAAGLLADYLFEINTPFSQFTNREGKSAWVLAIENDNEYIFDRLLPTNDNIEAVNNQGHTPLFFATIRNKPYFVHLLLARGANFNAIDKIGDTPITKAVRQGFETVVDEFLAYPVNLNILNKNNENSLSIAIHKRYFSLVSKLIWAGGNLSTNPAQFHNNEDIFHINSFGQYEKLVTNSTVNEINNFKALNQLGFNLNQKNEQGDTFLLTFIKKNFLANFKTLLKCSMDGNQIDAQGNSALMLAVTQSTRDYTLTMLNRFNNLDLNIVNHKGDNVYDNCLTSQHIDNLILVLNYDKSISETNAQKAILLITQKGNLEEYFDKLQSKSSIKLEHLVDSDGNSLLMMAVKNKNKDNFSFLLQVSPQLNTKHINHQNQNLNDLINDLPLEEKKYFDNELSTYIKKQVKKP